MFEFVTLVKRGEIFREQVESGEVTEGAVDKG